MPLKPTCTLATEERFEVAFTMMDGETAVRCFVDEGAIEDVGDDEENDDTLIERFGRHRAVFEAIASWLYDEGATGPRIELHHVAQFRER